MTTLRRNTVDLHTHTARSDGVLEPLQLYEQMRAWGSTLVAITDHDTLAGARELIAAGRGAPGTSAPGPNAPSAHTRSSAFSMTSAPPLDSSNAT